MVASDVLKKQTYSPAAIVFIGGHITEALKGQIRSERNADGTYVIDVGGAYLRIHESTILGEELTIEQKHKNLSKHMTEVLLKYQTCIQENHDLRKANDSLYKDLKELREYAIRMNNEHDHLVTEVRRLVKINSELQFRMPRF
jgi:hypothetical protein